MGDKRNPGAYPHSHTHDDEREPPRRPQTMCDWFVPCLIGAAIFVIAIVLITSTETPRGWCGFLLFISVVFCIMGFDPCGSRKRTDDILE